MSSKDTTTCGTITVTPTQLPGGGFTMMSDPNLVWSSPNWTISGTAISGFPGSVTIANTSATTYTLSDKFSTDIVVEGDANIKGDLMLGGKSVLDRLAVIEERLAIIHTNSKLEEKWEELKNIGEQYRKLELQLMEKEKVWDILKK